MKKYEMVALTGVLLSATILGANTSVVEAASKSKEIHVKNELKEDPVIEATSSLSDAVTTGKQKFSDLKDGQTLEVSPIFQEDVDSSNEKYETLLQNKLGIVDDKGNPLTMTIEQRDKKTNFASKVSYKNGEQTKTFNLKYNYFKPELISGRADPMNFKGTSLPSSFNDAITSGDHLNDSSTNVSKLSRNKTDLNGHKAVVETKITQISPDIDTKGGEIVFVPTDTTYNVEGAPLIRHVKIFQEPNWQQLSNRTLQLNDKTGLAKPVTITDSNGNKYSVTIKSGTVDITKPGKYTVTYEATGIDDNGTPVIDEGNHVVGQNIIYTKQNQSITVSGDTTQVNYNFIIKDKNTGDVIDTQSGQAADGSTITVDTSKLPSGYTLSNAQKTFKVDAKNPSKTIEIAKSVNYDIKYLDKDTNKQIGKDVTGTGDEGSSIVLQVPSGYDFANASDMMLTLNSKTPQKTIYLTRKSIPSIPAERLDYTIQYKDSKTSEVVDKTTGQGNLGDYINVKAPDGYSLADLSSYGFLLNKENMTFTSYVTKADTSYRISYIDENTNKEVGTQTGEGAVGSNLNLKVPTGYTLINADDAIYQIKNGSKDVQILVKKAEDSDDLGLVSTYPDGGSVQVYDANGKAIDVDLAQASDWVTDQLKSINGVEYYRVATDKYIRTDKAYKYVPFSDVIVTSKETPVYDCKGKLNTEKVLGKNTPWYTDRIAEINGIKMYRVATNMWVKAGEVKD
ncbi:SLAP domain-containing protein [Companilactobacillus sp. HBUAS56275]|uniref:SLAP domain-containing protein n=1 Tax=Candidatus Companilactobacillus pullicola TaxID=2838523 RepID=A0A9D2CNP1_9LACO|nr:SLAP domain-containing protein [Candidatus Companilactobacillus pullicola]